MPAGICVSDPLRIQVTQQVSLDVPLPYSMVRGEHLELLGSVYNQLSKDSWVSGAVTCLATSWFWSWTEMLFLTITVHLSLYDQLAVLCLIITGLKCSKLLHRTFMKSVIQLGVEGQQNVDQLGNPCFNALTCFFST